MSRLIDEDELLLRVIGYRGNVDRSVAKRLILQSPDVEVVAVVRCKDCKHRTELCGVGWHPCTDMAVNSNWYCADGERKEDAID